MIINHHTNKRSYLVTICSLVSILNLLFLSTATATETSRTAESMLSGRTHKMAPTSLQKQETEKTSRTAEQMLNSSQPKQEKTLLPPAPVVSQQSKPHVVQKKKTYLTNSSQILSGVKIEVQSCKYVPEYKSITCDMTLTNQEHDTEAVIHCYTGTMAKDEKGNNLQCAHIWLGSNHSWNFAHGKLLQGRPVKGMVRLETKKAPVKLNKLEISLALNGTAQVMTVKNIPVQ